MNIRNLEQIQEGDGAARSGSRLGTLLLASLGGAALVVVGVMVAKREGPAAKSTEDPLATLVAEAKQGVPAEALDGRDVTFPGILSDDETPTTALAAVKDQRGRLVKQPEEVLASADGAEPPPASDRLPVVPLPAGTLLNATSVTTDPKDSLTAMAVSAAKAAASGELAPPGNADGYQIQVASFKDPADADKFVEQLRQRGHSAFRQAAYVPDRGLWHRVRIGPFKTKYEANQYRAKFEKAERMSPFVVDPERAKQAEEARAAKLEARIKKYGRE